MGSVFCDNNYRVLCAPQSTRKLKRLSAKTAINHLPPNAYCKSVGNQTKSFANVAARSWQRSACCRVAPNDHRIHSKTEQTSELWEWRISKFKCPLSKIYQSLTIRLYNWIILVKWWHGHFPYRANETGDFDFFIGPKSNQNKKSIPETV